MGLASCFLWVGRASTEERTGSGAAVYLALAAVIEYLAAENLETGACRRCCEGQQKKRILAVSIFLQGLTVVHGEELPWCSAAKEETFHSRIQWALFSATNIQF